jgi:MOSC domain-containing protein YiiM|tara:strand:+ start:330 stop:782 length:453 start_codon:yes stop_codon:yes gene_type:complete
MNKIPKVFKIGLCKIKSQKVDEVSKIKVLSNKGIIGDRHFHDHQSYKGQITLIEKENIDYYNNKYNTKISYIDFRRNVITEGIELNDLVRKEIEVGTVKILPYELCRPCSHLEQMVGYNNIIKEFLRKGGLRCKVLVSGEVNIGDKIKIL